MAAHWRKNEKWKRDVESLHENSAYEAEPVLNLPAIRPTPCALQSAKSMPAVTRQTIFSADRMYRYTLWREWSDDLFRNRTNEGYVMFIGLNPSTADETQDDPTIRRCMGFVKRWGYLTLCMTNLFAFRATDPRKMKAHPKPIGDENDRWLVAVAREADLIVAAWGVDGRFMARDEEVMKLLDDVQCLRVTKGGYPEHPLYIPYDTELIPCPPHR